MRVGKGLVGLLMELGEGSGGEVRDPGEEQDFAADIFSSLTLLLVNGV